MARDYGFSDRLDFAMGIMAVVGVGVAVLIPLLLIISSIILQIPYIDHLVIVCEVTGCVIVGVALSYFICRKEM